MRYADLRITPVRVVGSILVGAVLAICASAYAETRPAPPLPSAEKIRQHFVALESERGPVPELVAKVFALTVDRNFYRDYPSPTQLAWTIAPTYPDTGIVELKGAVRHIYRLGITLSLSKALSADELAAHFARSTYLGQGCYGVADAAGAYFGKPVADITLAETTLLAAMILSPASSHPIKRKDVALSRRKLILDRLTNEGLISPESARSAANAEIVTRNPLGSCD